MSLDSDNHHKAAKGPILAPLSAAIHDGKTHLLLAASGSVAVVKLPSIISSFRDYPNLSIRIILTQNARRFFLGQSSELPTLASLRALPNVDAIYEDKHEWMEPWVRGTDILHIQLRRWAHLLVVAPLSANTLAKIAGGLADNLLISVIRAWDINPGNRKRACILVAAAMNSIR
jgi:phosphopantothenoylcysteine decarboxylase